MNELQRQSLVRNDNIFFSLQRGFRKLYEGPAKFSDGKSWCLGGMSQSLQLSKDNKIT